MLFMLKIHIQGGQTGLSSDKVSILLVHGEKTGTSLVFGSAVNLA